MSCCQSKTENEIVTNALMCHGCARRWGPLCPSGRFVSVHIENRDCPRGRFVKDGVVRWWWIRWIGVPMPLRWWARLTLRKCPKAPGCGCVKVLKDGWERVKGVLC